MTVTRGEVIFYAAAWALGSLLGALRAAYLIRQDDLAAELATVLALPTRKETS